jgi:hypothetical protein
VPEGDHQHHGERRTLGHYARDFFTNWSTYEGPLGRKLWVTIRNRGKAIAPPFKGCCGRHGEPGC